MTETTTREGPAQSELARRDETSWIAACVVCRNEGDRLGDCLASVSWADEILVVDLSSSDDSAEVARRHGARVISRAPVPIVELVRNEIAAHARGDWILALDPDERVSAGLAAALDALRDRAEIAAVEIPFMHVDFGHPPKNPLHRYDHKPRMYRRSRVTWPTEPNKLPVVPKEQLHRIAGKDELVMVHLRNRTIPEAIERAFRYAPAEAQALIDAGELFSARKMVRVLSHKVRRHFVDGRAFDDGVPGFMRAAVLLAFYFYVWAAFWQMSGAQRNARDDAYMRRFGRVVQGIAGLSALVRAPGKVIARLRRNRTST